MTNVTVERGEGQKSLSTTILLLFEAKPVTHVEYFGGADEELVAEIECRRAAKVQAWPTNID